MLKYGAVSGLSMIAGNDTPKQVPTGGWSAPVLMGAACLATGSAAATAWGLEVVARAASCGFVAAELNPACTCSTWTRLALLQLQLTCHVMSCDGSALLGGRLRADSSESARLAALQRLYAEWLGAGPDGAGVCAWFMRCAVASKVGARKRSQPGARRVMAVTNPSQVVRRGNVGT